MTIGFLNEWCDNRIQNSERLKDHETAREET